MFLFDLIGMFDSVPLAFERFIYAGNICYLMKAVEQITVQVLLLLQIPNDDNLINRVI